MKKALALPVLLMASIGHASVSKSISCQVTRNDGTSQQTSVLKKNLVPNEEGGLSQSVLRKDSKLEVTAYSSEYKPDAGNRLFLEVNGIVVAAEADMSSNVRLVFTKTGDATYTYYCNFR